MVCASIGDRPVTAKARYLYACSSVISVSHAKGHADGARIARKSEHRTGVARLRAQILEVVRVEEILDPKRSFPGSRRNVTDADVHKAVAVECLVAIFAARRDDPSRQTRQRSAR